MTKTKTLTETLKEMIATKAELKAELNKMTFDTRERERKINDNQKLSNEGKSEQVAKMLDDNDRTFIKTVGKRRQRMNEYRQNLMDGTKETLAEFYSVDRPTNDVLFNRAIKRAKMEATLNGNIEPYRNLLDEYADNGTGYLLAIEDEFTDVVTSGIVDISDADVKKDVIRLNSSLEQAVRESANDDMDVQIAFELHESKGEQLPNIDEHDLKRANLSEILTHETHVKVSNDISFVDKAYNKLTSDESANANDESESDETDKEEVKSLSDVASELFDDAENDVGDDA